MAEIKFNFSEYRPCIICGKNALFHRWADKAQLIGESLLRGGHPAGQLWDVVGIVEFEDGTVHEVYPYEIRFIDYKFKDFAIPEKQQEG